MWSVRCRPDLVLIALLILVHPSWAEEPLHIRIDRLIAAGMSDYAKIAAPVASDAEFLRRITLDLTGTIPTAVEAKAFFSDSAPDKRAKLIDRLLASPEHARHLTLVFDVALMDRRPDNRVSGNEWREFLYSSFLANKPWDVMVREILSADGADPKDRGRAKFLLDRDRDFEPYGITRDLGRVFLGVNLTCAQCHDHPTVDHYKQADFYGLFAFLNRTTLSGPANRGKDLFLIEKSDGEATYQNVFDKAKVTKTALPRVPGGKPIPDVKVEKAKEPVAAKIKGADPKPQPPAYSRRAQLATAVAGPDSPGLRRAAANRFWWLMLGRGIVHPIDLDHPDNPPSHPELLDVLSAEFAAHQFNVRWLLKEIALSQTYQRSSERPSGGKDVPADAFAVAALKALPPEQFALTLMQATGFTETQRLANGKPLPEPKVFGKLEPFVRRFAATFGNAPGQPDTGDFTTTMEQTLFLINGSVVRDWLKPAGNNLTAHLLKLTEPAAIADELYLSVLTRLPTVEEKKEVEEYLRATNTADRATALGELVAALLATAEFRFNH